ncbi:MAG: DUF5668 domain-containing protein [Bacteroidota bacterium]
MDEYSTPSDQTSRVERDRRRGRATGGIILIVMGGLFLLRNLYPWFRFQDYWPVILIVLGVILVWRSRAS